MIRLQPSSVRRAAWLRTVFAVVLFASLFGAGGGRTYGQDSGGITSTDSRPPAEAELFGMVVRDPFYEYNTDPVNFHEAPNRTALERQAIELHTAGVKWIRMEFFADYDGTVPKGDINWSKYDWFINELAPKYDLKVLALLNVGMVSYDGRPVRTVAFNDPPDGGGTDTNDGSNHFIRVFTGRAQAIAARYGTAISAYEIINEPNISFDLWVDSHNGGAEIKPERYAALLTSSYRAIKSVNPKAEVTTGGMLIGSPPEGQDHDQFDYLYQLYTSQWVDRYRTAGYGSRPGWNVVPWDGVALHPYFLDTTKLFPLLRDFARKLRDRDDFHSKLWITEIGATASPPDNPLDKPTPDEIEQAGYLRSVYGGILADSELHSIISHVFWFKYEDFVPGNYTHNYGLVRLLETPDGKDYAPSGQVWVHKLAYKVYQELANGYSLTDPLAHAQGAADDPFYFAETGQSIAPEFATYWRDKGGMGRFGYPISRPVLSHGILSQFFERAVFEYHPEYKGTPAEVLLRLVGNEFTQGRYFDKPDQASIPPDHYFFPQTGHTLGGAFLSYWVSNGGLPIYGYPISEEMTEVSPTDGQSYAVQYFERNRFEYHPEAAGTPYEVQLGLLGANILQHDLWWR
ncbi:MAG: hypothetical protein ACJ78Q_20025 [Chloroflexia bacterium]